MQRIFPADTCRGDPASAGSVRRTSAPKPAEWRTARMRPFRPQAGVLILLAALLIPNGCSRFSSTRKTKDQPGQSQTTEGGQGPSPGAADDVQHGVVEIPSEAQPPANHPNQKTIATIKSGVLLVNGQPIRVGMVLARSHHQLQQAAETNNEKLFLRRAASIVRQCAYDMISEAIVYRKIERQFTDEQNKGIDKVIDKALRNEITEKAGGSQARFERTLARYGVTLEQYRDQLRRKIVARQWLREKFTPKIHVSRRQLWRYYHQNLEKFSSARRVHLHLIEIDAAKLLPSGKTWKTATPQQRRQARERADQRAQQARTMLAQGQPFAQVARRFSTAASGKAGGDMGWVRQGSFRIKAVDEAAFRLQCGRISEVIPVGHKRFILTVSEVEPAKRIPFVEAQEQIRPQLQQQQYQEQITDYVNGLWSAANIGPVEPFLEAIADQMPSYRWLRSSMAGR